MAQLMAAGREAPRGLQSPREQSHPLAPLPEARPPIIKLLREHTMTPGYLGHIRSLLETLLYDPRLRRRGPSLAIFYPQVADSR